MLWACILFAVFLVAVADLNIDLYAAPWQKGRKTSILLKDQECHWTPNGTASASTDGGCIILFSETECKGESVWLRPGYRTPPYCPELGDLAWSPCNFNNRTHSMKMCPPDAAPLTNKQPVKRRARKVSPKRQ